MAEPIEMDLATLCDGGVVEQFRLALAEVSSSVLDVNTDPEAKRQIVMTVTFAPDDTRRVVGVTAQTVVKLPGRSPVRTLAYTSRRPGGTGFVEQAPPEQQILDVVADLQPKVHAGGKK
jgi:hypothetical protein